jgi:hypothetical protein
MSVLVEGLVTQNGNRKLQRAKVTNETCKQRSRRISLCPAIPTLPNSLPIPQSAHGGRSKDISVVSGRENVLEGRPSAAEGQDGGGELAPPATAGQSPKAKRGAWLSQSVDLSNMSRWRKCIVCDV